MNEDIPTQTQSPADDMATNPLPEEGGQDGETFDAHITRWPRVIGIISIIYALLGLLGQVLGVLMSFLGEWFASLGGMDVTMPAVIKFAAVGSGLVLFVFGIMLLVGGVRLLRRARSGVMMIKRWALLRLLFLLLWTGVGVVLLPANVEFQRRITEAANEQLRENGQENRIQDFDESAKWKQALIGMAIGAGVVSAYPLFVGFYLSRRKIDTEISQWT